MTGKTPSSTRNGWGYAVFQQQIFRLQQVSVRPCAPGKKVRDLLAAEWVTPADLVLIPERMREYTLRHFDKEQLKDVFGSTEAELYDMLMATAGHGFLYSCS